MKALLISMFIVCFGFAAYAQQTTTTTTTTTYVSPGDIKTAYPHYSMGIIGGGIFPLPKVLNQTFKPGANVEVDGAVRINKEVGLYVSGSYSFMASKVT